MILYLLIVFTITIMCVIPEFILDARLYKKKIKQDKVGQMFWRIALLIAAISNVVLPINSWYYISYVLGMIFYIGSIYGFTLDTAMNIYMKVDTFSHEGTTSKIDKATDQYGVWFHIFFFIIGIILISINGK